VTYGASLSPNQRNQSFHVPAILVVFHSEVIHHEGLFESGLSQARVTMMAAMKERR
jgi:hypothetical protein